jgi:hypothetical protein
VSRSADRDLESALRAALEPHGRATAPPEGIHGIPDDWIQPPGRESSISRMMTPIAVAITAGITTWVALASFAGTAGPPLSPAGTAGPAASMSPSNLSSGSPSETTSAAPSNISEVTPPPSPDSPPEVRLAGVAGEPVTWCYGNACVDGVYVGPVEALPQPAELGAFDASVGFNVTAAHVFGSDGTSAAVSLTGNEVGELPGGEWERIQISVTFGSGEATYLWRLP